MIKTNFVLESLLQQKILKSSYGNYQKKTKCAVFDTEDNDGNKTQAGNLRAICKINNINYTTYFHKILSKENVLEVIETNKLQHIYQFSSDYRHLGTTCIIRNYHTIIFYNNKFKEVIDILMRSHYVNCSLFIEQ
ncbi:hypothetical protein ACIMS1_004488 [Vibrio harveyi]